jgi:zinc transport system ATP-binding protein
MSPLVDIRDLDFAYREQPVLREIGLTVERGTTLGVIGPNGGGKTTLMRLLLGLLRPTRGEIRVDGMQPREAVARGDVMGYLPQHLPDVEQFPLTVRQVVRLGLSGKTGMLRGYRREDLAFVDELIERLGLGELAQERIGELSGGQLQRVFIAKALSARPKLLILDEPTTAIDRSAQQRVIEMIQQLKAELSLTIILISHDLRAVGAIADRIACLNVSLHYHDVPEHIPADLVYSMFACDLEAMGLGRPRDVSRLRESQFVPLNVSEKR